MRRQFRASPSAKDGPRINREIRGITHVQLIGEEGDNLGTVGLFDALNMAVEADLDLVEISPNSQPPVCKLMDYGRYKYEIQKKAAATKKNQKVIEIKEIKVRPTIDPHDYETKLKQARKFIQDSCKLRITLKFRGREVSHQDLGIQLLQKFRDDLSDISKVEVEPVVEGKTILMALAPK